MNMKPFVKAVLTVTLITGTLDMIAAYVSQFIRTGKFAAKMFHYIAGGALGLERSMNGGFGVVLLGIFFHYFIAFSFTLFFFLLYPKLRFLSINKYLFSLIVGVFIVVMMNFVVLPLTPLPPSAFDIKGKLIAVMVLSAVVGLPIAIGARRYYGPVF
jgi:hypothetical protein